MTFSSRLAEFAFYVAVVAILSVLAHLTIVLLIPVVATRDAFAALTELTPVGPTAPLPRATPAARRFAYLDPAVASAFCRFDLSNGPVRVRAPLGRSAFSALSFHTHRGAVFYALTDRAAAHGKLEALIVTPAQLRQLVVDEDEDNPSDDLRIVSPTVDGYVLIRVFSELPSLYRDAEDQAKTLVCASEPANK